MKLNYTFLIAGIILFFASRHTNAQTIYTFTAAGATGETGPTQAMVNTAYTSTNLDGKVQVVNGIQYWEVPVTGTYVIEAYGGQGYGSFGGRGAHITGEFLLSGGDSLKILVGQKAGDYLAFPATTNDHQFGGGGGSFVTQTNNTPYVVAGGGGGNHGTSFSTTCDGQITTNGAAGTNGSTVGAGGTAGGGGLEAASADGGGGLLGNGTGTSGGMAFVNGGAGGFLRGRGGFGGGGGTSNFNNYRGGGGGGSNNAGTCCPTAGGGGSFNAGTNQVNLAGVQLGDGKVIITQLPSSPNDAGILDIIEPGNSCEGTYTVKAVVANFGTNQIDSVRINWNINGTPQTAYSYKLLLDTINGTGQNKDTITLGNITLTAGVTDNIKAWTLLPNNEADTVNGNDTTLQPVLGYAYPVVDLGPDTTICSGLGDFGVLESNTGFPDSLRWSTGQTNAPSIVVVFQGTYSIQVYENGCESRDTVNVFHHPPAPTVDLGQDTTICPEDSIVLDATTPGVTYEWQNSSTAATQKVKTGGQYWVIIEDANTCHNSDTINVSIYKAPGITLMVSPGNNLCYGVPYTFTATGNSEGSIMYQWKINGVNSGSPTTINTFTPTLNYGDSVSVDLITDLCVSGTTAISSNSITMFINPQPRLITGQDTVIENTTESYAVSLSPTSTYSWSVAGGSISGSTSGNTVSVDWGTASSTAMITCEETVNGCTYPNEKAVVVVSIVGIKGENESIAMGHAYPNPAQSRITIPIVSKGQWEIDLDLYDMTGKAVKSIYHGALNGSKEITFDVDDLENGMYFYKISTSDGYGSVKRITIQR